MRKKIAIEGMSCGHCVKRVKDALLELEGLISADIDLDTQTAVIDSTGEVSDEKIKFALDDVGYEAISIEIL